jgi:hypothetical protein
MLTEFSKWVSKVSSGWVALVALLIFLVFTAMVLPGQSAKMDSYSGSAGSPDLSLYYSANDLYQMADTYGAEGRSAYIHARFTFDLAFPIIYLFFLSTGISWVNRRVFEPESRWQLTNLLPFGALLFDLLENASAALVIGRYPETTPVVPYLAGFFTTLKWVFVGSSCLMLVVVLMIVMVRVLNKKKV